jgi:hypothetical protein
VAGRRSLGLQHPRTIWLQTHADEQALRSERAVRAQG